MKKIKQKRGWIMMVIAIIILLIIDQIAKVSATIYAKESQTLIEGILNIHYIRNTGVAFGIIKNNPFLVMIMEIIVLLFIIRFLILQYDRMNTGTKVALSFILAGGSSNLIDRIVYRGVVDYIDISSMLNEFPVFNLADMYVIIGLLLFIISFAVYGVSQTKKEQEWKGKISK